MMRPVTVIDFRNLRNSLIAGPGIPRPEHYRAEGQVETLEERRRHGLSAETVAVLCCGTVAPTWPYDLDLGFLRTLQMSAGAIPSLAPSCPADSVSFISGTKSQCCQILLQKFRASQSDSTASISRYNIVYGFDEPELRDVPHLQRITSTDSSVLEHEPPLDSSAS